MNFRMRTPTVLLGVHTTTAQHCFCAVQLNWCRGGGGIHGWYGGGDGGDGAAGGGGTRPEGSTEHYNQSMCVGLMINPLSLPSLGALGSSLYKGTSILLMFASKHLSPPRFSSPLWMGARSGSQHHRIGLLGPARDRATSNCHNDHFILNQFGLSGDKGAAEP